jgi:hypothetical protein
MNPRSQSLRTVRGRIDRLASDVQADISGSCPHSHVITKSTFLDGPNACAPPWPPKDSPDRCQCGRTPDYQHLIFQVAVDVVMRALKLTGVRQRVDRLHVEAKRLSPEDLVRILHEGRLRAARGEQVRLTPEESRERGRRLRALATLHQSLPVSGGMGGSGLM